VREIPDDATVPASLLMLNLTGNQLFYFPVVVLQWSGLTHLNVTWNMMLDLPPDIGSHLPNLEVLDASYNHIRVLPDSIVDLPVLRELNMCENSISELPAEIGRMSALRVLDIRYNKLDGFPDSMRGLTELTTLKATSHYESHMPAWIGCLRSLQTLHMLSNYELKFPASVMNLTNLTKYDDCENSSRIIYPAVLNLCTNTSHLRMHPLTWHKRYHHRFPREFKDMVLTLVLCNKRETCMPYLPLEMIWAVLETVQYF
jgi:Leucine-rich repeat (LRR) protein